MAQVQHLIELKEQFEVTARSWRAAKDFAERRALLDKAKELTSQARQLIRKAEREWFRRRGSRPADKCPLLR